MASAKNSPRRRIAFARINDNALSYAESILARWLPTASAKEASG